MTSEIIVNTSNIEIGDCFKNYKDLCSALNQPVYSGCQKKAQLDNFRRFFDYEKIGIKFYITDIYETPLPKQHKYPANAIYVQYIEHILLQYLSQHPNGEVYIPSQYLWLELGMINYNFIEMQDKDKKNELLELNEKMTMFQINNFYKRCRFKFNKIIESSFESLRKQKRINYWKIHTVKHLGKFKTEEATLTEEQLILKIEREILDEFGFEKINEVFLKNKADDFYKKRNEKASDLFGVSEIFDCYHIIHVHENTVKALSKSEVQIQKLMLNKEVIKFINGQAERLYESDGEENEEVKRFIDEGYWPCEKKPFYYYRGYVDMQYLLSDKLLKIE